MRFALLLVAAVAAGHFVYPYWTVQRIERAVHDQDIATLDALIDWPQVRAGLKNDTRGFMLAKTGAATGTGFEALGTMFGLTFVDTMIDGSVSAQALVNLPAIGRSISENVVDQGFVTPTTFRLSVLVKEVKFSLVLEMSGLSWRITRVVWSPEVIAAMSPALPPAPSPPPPPLLPSEAENLRKHISKCWSPPVVKDSDRHKKPVIRVLFKRDGSIIGNPAVVSSYGDSDHAAKNLADSAVRAIRSCGPYNFLPASKYETWKDIEITFDP
jgi:DUF2939 family protein